MKIFHELTLPLCSTVLAQKIHPLRMIEKNLISACHPFHAVSNYNPSPPMTAHEVLARVPERLPDKKNTTKVHYISGTRLFKFNAPRERLARCNSYCIYKLIGLVYHAKRTSHNSCIRRLLGSSTYKTLINKNEKKSSIFIPPLINIYNLHLKEY